MSKKNFLMLFICVIFIITSLIFVSSCAQPAKPVTPTPTTPTPTPPAKEVLIRVTTPIPPVDEMIAWAQEGMDKFNARTKGAYKMQMFPGGQLCRFPESLDAIRTGSIEGGFIPPAAFAGAIPELGLVELPFLFNNAEANTDAAIALRDVLYNPLLEQKANQRAVGNVCVGLLNIGSTKKQIKTLEDLKGLIVGCDTPPMADLIKALGGSGIIVDFTEDYSNLQKGVIDAKTLAPMYIYVGKLYEVLKYYTVFNGIGTLYSFTINLDIYNKMPQDIKNALNEEMTATGKNMSLKLIEKFKELKPILTEKGLQYYYLTPAERERWKARAYPTTLATLEKFGDYGAKVKKASDEANAKYPYKPE